jgi:nucleotide-binding universal stress UspA family protein
VWAVAFACVVSFMGIGLVDPILPALSQQLKASPSTVELLFTSYLVVTAVAMLVTGWVSSRIGGKRTLVAGLVLIVAFSAAAGASHSIAEIIEFRAGWGLGNALFIATSLAVIIGAASGGFSGAIILYETALGIGIALGPLVGVHVPFYLAAGVVLAAIAVLATGHSVLTRAERDAAAELSIPARGPAGPLVASSESTATPQEDSDNGSIVAAVSATADAASVTATAIEFAELLGCPVEILHVVETDIVGELAVDAETLDAARNLVADHVDRLRVAGIPGTGHLLRVVSGHGDAGRRIAGFASEHQAQMIVIGPPRDSEIAGAFNAGLTGQLIRHAHCAVHICGAGRRPRALPVRPGTDLIMAAAASCGPPR